MQTRLFLLILLKLVLILKFILISNKYIIKF